MKYIIFGLVFFLTGSLNAKIITIGGKNIPFSKWGRFRGSRAFLGKDAMEQIRLADYSFTAERGNLLYLNFNEEKPYLLKDISGNFKIKSARYKFSPDAYSGNGAALFYERGSRILIRSPRQLWPGSGIVGDFTIEMMIKPYLFSLKNVLFRKDAIHSSLAYGINKRMELYLKEGRLYFEIKNLFIDSNNRLKSIRLASRERLKKNKWSNIIISYNAEIGKIILFINGYENKVIFAKDKSGVWILRFRSIDRSPIVIGQNYFGLIDEFRITNFFLDRGRRMKLPKYPALQYDDRNYLGKQKRGSFISKIIKIKGIAKRGTLKFDFIRPKGTQINLYYRASFEPISNFSGERKIKWRKVVKIVRNIHDFRFIQFKAVLRADPKGEKTPVLKKVKLEYQTYRPPQRPTNFSIIQKDISVCKISGNVCLEWDLNPEFSIIPRYGYTIFFGIRPGEYTGKISYVIKNKFVAPIKKETIPAKLLSKNELKFKKNHPVYFRRRFNRKIRFLLSNHLIVQNTIYNRRLGKYAVMPYLRPNRTYYFAVMAYYRTASGLLIKSRLSKEAAFSIPPSSESED